MGYESKPKFLLGDSVTLVEGRSSWNFKSGMVGKIVNYDFDDDDEFTFAYGVKYKDGGYTDTAYVLEHDLKLLTEEPIYEAEIISLGAGRVTYRFRAANAEVAAEKVNAFIAGEVTDTDSYYMRDLFKVRPKKNATFTITYIKQEN